MVTERPSPAAWSQSDEISLRGVRFVGRHGVGEDERRGAGRAFEVDFVAWVGTAKAGLSDDLRDTVDYRVLAQCAMEIGTGQSFHLIEALADAIARAVLSVYPDITLSVEVRKLDPPVPGGAASAGVRIVRGRGRGPS